MDTTSSDIKNQFNAKAERVADKASHAVDRARRAGEEFLETPVAERIQEGFKNIRTKSMDAYDSSVATIRRNPVAWLGAALGCGIVAGLLFGRRSRT